MVIGYNENVFVTDYSNCASVMEAAVNLFQETKENEKFFYTYINEAVDVKAIKNKIISTLKSWLSKILGIIRKIKSVIMEKISKIKDFSNIKNSKVTFSFESYDLEKINIDTLNKFRLAGEEDNFPKSYNDSSYEQYVKNKIKDWTGKSNKMDCTAGDIKQYIYDKYCGGQKITITEKIPGYSPSTFDKYSGKSLNRYLDNLEKDSKNIVNSLRQSIEQVSDVVISNYMYRAYFNYMDLNSRLIVALSNIITEKISLNNKINSIYASANKQHRNVDEFTQSYMDAIRNEDIKKIRSIIGNSLMADYTFKDANKMLRLAKNVDGLFDSHNSEELITDKSKWNEEYMNKQFVLLPNNFSHERLNHLKKVVSYLYNK